MMNREENILTAFQKADEETRLYLFLAHRDLRSDFMAMVQQSAEQVPVTAPRASLLPIQRCRRWLLAKLPPFCCAGTIGSGDRARA